MDLAHQNIAFRLNNRGDIESENMLMDKMEREATPLFFAIMFVMAGMVIGTPIYFAGQQSAMKKCPPVNQGERLIYSEQSKDGTTLCHYSSGWNLYGHKKISRWAK